MSNSQGNQKFISMLLILVSLFIFIFFTKGYYINLIENIDSKTEKEKIYKEKIKLSDNLSIVQKDFKKLDGEKYNSIKKFSNILIENELIYEIYSSVNKNTQNGETKILSLSMSKGVKNELGFMESKINILARFENENVMNDYLDYLIKDSKYKFFITSLQLPKIQENKSFNVNIPLTLFYVNIK